MTKIVLALYVYLLGSNFSAAQTNPARIAPQSDPVTKQAGADNAERAASLPVRRVVLYKNGVGYFEHLGRVHGSQKVHVDFTSAQLNDVLKSLTVLDLSGGRITGVDYNSEAPLARRLATLRLALGEKPSMADFLAALRGARVEVRGPAGPPLAGKLLSVERKTRNSASWTVETDEISLITDAGDVRSIDLTPATGVRIAEHDLQSEVGKYLDLIASARDQDVRRMTLSTTGSGERNLYVSYISEVPIWKTTYRIVLPTKPEKKPLLQGWAIVDNTVGEDWNDVELSLVAGAPHSFIQQLSEPSYGRRPVVALPESVQLSPQTHAATLIVGNGSLSGTVTDPSGGLVAGVTVRLVGPDGAVVAQTSTDSRGQYSFSSQLPGNYRIEMERTGFRKTIVSNLNLIPGTNQINGQLQPGSTAQTVEVTADAASLNTSYSVSSQNGGKLPVANRSRVNFGSLGGVSGGVVGGVIGGIGGPPPPPVSLESARAMAEAAANGQGLGDLFEYKLKDRVTLKKNQSALVPIVQTEVVAEPVSLWSGTAGSGRPLRCLWLKNTSSLTLDGGSFTVLENEVFAGEGITDAIKPGERRLVSYATDLGLLVQAEANDRPQHVTRVKISKGVLTQISELQQRTLYTARNEDEAARQLVVEHPARYSWNLVKGSRQPEEQAPGVYRFRLDVPAKATAALPVEEAHIQQTTYQLAELNDDQIELFVRQQTITPEMQEALSKITAQKALVAKLEEEMENRQKDIERIVDDQGRLRENMKALRGSAEEKALLQRYTKQLDEQETLLDALRKKIRETEAQRDQANDALGKMIDDLQLEATF
ncbi:MAG TPA: carboxypeptidase regulatory-like domain-containing protein [Candidatus Acidoferrum sp.]|nr:carboxypeptidase regulatory-like domain-containing protein [Candidatus Acidoferrum sp.]